MPMFVSEWLTGYLCGVVIGVGIGRWWSLTHNERVAVRSGGRWKQKNNLKFRNGNKDQVDI